MDARLKNATAERYSPSKMETTSGSRDRRRVEIFTPRSRSHARRPIESPQSSAGPGHIPPRKRKAEGPLDTRFPWKKSNRALRDIQDRPPVSARERREAYGREETGNPFQRGMQDLVHTTRLPTGMKTRGATRRLSSDGDKIPLNPFHSCRAARHSPDPFASGYASRVGSQSTSDIASDSGYGGSAMRDGPATPNSIFSDFEGGKEEEEEPVRYEKRSKPDLLVMPNGTVRPISSTALPPLRPGMAAHFRHAQYTARTVGPRFVDYYTPDGTQHRLDQELSSNPQPSDVTTRTTFTQPPTGLPAQTAPGTARLLGEADRLRAQPHSLQVQRLTRQGKEWQPSPDVPSQLNVEDWFDFFGIATESQQNSTPFAAEKSRLPRPADERNVPSTTEQMRLFQDRVRQILGTQQQQQEALTLHQPYAHADHMRQDMVNAAGWTETKHRAPSRFAPAGQSTSATSMGRTRVCAADPTYKGIGDTRGDSISQTRLGRLPTPTLSPYLPTASTDSLPNIDDVDFGPAGLGTETGLNDHAKPDSVYLVWKRTGDPQETCGVSTGRVGIPRRGERKRRGRLRRNTKRGALDDEPRLFTKRTISEDHSNGLEADRLKKLRVITLRSTQLIPHRDPQDEPAWTRGLTGIPGMPKSWVL